VVLRVEGGIANRAARLIKWGWARSWTFHREVKEVDYMEGGETRERTRSHRRITKKEGDKSKFRISRTMSAGNRRAGENQEKTKKTFEKVFS